MTREMLKANKQKAYKQYREDRVSHQKVNKPINFIKFLDGYRTFK